MGDDGELEDEHRFAMLRDDWQELYDATAVAEGITQQLKSGLAMKLDDAVERELYELEVSLWRPETRFDNDYMDGLLTDDFFEFGRSGRTYRREETLSAPMQEIDIDLPLKDFQVHSVADDVVLVTYISEVQYEELEIGNRSSLWVWQDGGWKLRFHQGTAVRR